MELHKLVDGIRVDLTEQEIQETLAVWEENERIAINQSLKNELELSFPTDSQKIDALMAQVDYLEKTQNIPISPDFQEITDKYDALLSDKRFKDLKSLIESSRPKQ